MTKADKEGQRKTPILRFKGFTDDWEQRELRETIERRTQKKESNNLPYIEYADIISNIGKLNKDIFSRKNTKQGIFFQKNDILFGKLRPYLNKWLKPQFAGIAVGDFWVLNGIKLNNDFLYYYIQTKKFSDVANITTGTKMPRSDWKLVSNSKIKFPNFEEQQNIGKLLYSLEKVITLYERKIKLLSQMKKYFLDNLFAKREYPNLRFKGFTDTWEQRQLNEVADVVSGGTPATDFSEYWNGNINWFTPNEINSQIYFSESKRKISNLGLKKSSAKLLPANRSILFTSRATIGEMGILTQDATTNQGFQSLVLHNEVIPYFIFSMKSTLKRQAIKKASGSTFLEISKREVEKLKIVIPSEKEQKKVSMLFKGIDNLFTLYKNKQQHLTEIKKTLLNTMFI